MMEDTMEDTMEDQIEQQNSVEIDQVGGQGNEQEQWADEFCFMFCWIWRNGQV